MKPYHVIIAIALVASCTSSPKEKILKNGDKIVMEGTTEKGIQRTYSKNGALREELPILNGKPNGLKKEYFSNGKIKEVVPIVNGFKNGIQKTYNLRGATEQEVPYVNGLEEGLVKLYYPNGKVKAKVTYSKGNPDEDLVEYDKGGAVMPQPKIHVKVRNTIALDNNLTFIISLNPSVKYFNLYASFPAGDKVFAYDKVKVKDGIGVYELHKYRSTSLFGEMEIYAVYKSTSGIKGKVKTRIRVAE